MPKPETKKVELRKDSINQLIALLEFPGEFNSYDPPMTYERRMAVAQRLERQQDK